MLGPQGWEVNDFSKGVHTQPRSSSFIKFRRWILTSTSPWRFRVSPQESN